jgi:hypothetical protein
MTKKKNKVKKLKKAKVNTPIVDFTSTYLKLREVWNEIDNHSPQVDTAGVVVKAEEDMPVSELLVKLGYITNLVWLLQESLKAGVKLLKEQNDQR